MENNFTVLQNVVFDYSTSKEWNEAVQEWEIVDFEEDKDMLSSCLCGKEHIKYLYTIENKTTGIILNPVGSKCIQKFDRDDMKDQINIYERLFKLVNARRDNKFIELKGKEKYFSNKLLDYLLEQDAINTGRHKTLKQLFNKRNELTDKQKKFATWIILNEIFPWLDKEIESKVKADSNITGFSDSNPGIAKLVKMRKQGKFISDDIFTPTLVKELNTEHAFSTYEYNRKTYNNYEIMLDLVSKEYTLTVKQRKLMSTILMRDILPHLDSKIEFENSNF